MLSFPVGSREVNSDADSVTDPWVTRALMVIRPMVLCGGFQPLAGAVLSWSGPSAVIKRADPSGRCAITGAPIANSCGCAGVAVGVGSVSGKR